MSSAMTRAEALTELVRAVRCSATADAYFPVLCNVADCMIGHRLFTVLLHEANLARTRRCFSSNLRDYPVGGTKALQHSTWTRTLYEEQRPFIATDSAAIRDTFPDHALIHSLGCESALNVPVVWAGRVMGTLNFLHEAHWYSDSHLPVAEILAALSVPAFIQATRGVEDTP